MTRPETDPILVPGAEPVSAAQAMADAATGDAALVDVRKRPAREDSAQTVSGAPYRDPARFDAFDPIWRGAAAPFVFCVHGHEVSQGVCAALRAEGIPARYVVGGFEALTTAGAALTGLGEDEAGRLNGGRASDQ